MVQEIWAFSLTVDGRTDLHSDYSAHLQVVKLFKNVLNDGQTKGKGEINTLNKKYFDTISVEGQRVSFIYKFHIFFYIVECK